MGVTQLLSTRNVLARSETKGHGLIELSKSFRDRTLRTGHGGAAPRTEHLGARHTLLVGDSLAALGTHALATGSPAKASRASAASTPAATGRASS